VLTTCVQKKRVTIVHGDSLPINAAYPDKFRRAVASSLKARGVELILGDYLDVIPAEGVTEVVTRNGRKLKGDLIVSIAMISWLNVPIGITDFHTWATI